MNFNNIQDTDRLVALRHREWTTEKMIRDIDNKISVLNVAKSERVEALKKIRSELARTMLLDGVRP